MSEADIDARVKEAAWISAIGELLARRPRICRAGSAACAGGDSAFTIELDANWGARLARDLEERRFWAFVRRIF